MNARIASASRTSAAGRVVASGRVNGSGRTPATADRSSVILFGDSITSQNGSVYTDRAGYSDIGFFWYAQNDAAINGALSVIQNRGISGDITASASGGVQPGMLDRLAPDVLWHRPAYVSVLAGTNDILDVVRTDSAIIANLTSIYDQVRAAGSRLIACVILPRQQWIVQSKQSNVDAINTGIRNYAAANADVLLVDWWNVFRDGVGSYAPLAGYTSDGTHPSATGAAVMGTAWAAAVAPTL